VGRSAKAISERGTNLVSAAYGPIVGALIALAGVGLSQLIAAHFRKTDRSWKIADENRSRVIERGEELYVLLEKWGNNFTASFLRYSRVMTGEIDYNSALDAVRDDLKRSVIQAERIGLIIGIYFPEIADEWKVVQQNVHKTSDIESDFRRGYKSGKTESAEHLTQYTQASLASMAMLRELSNKLLTALRTKFALPTS